MAVELRHLMIPGIVAGADLSAAQYTFVKLNAAGTAIAAGLGDVAVGVLQNKPALGHAAEIMASGVSKILVGTAIVPQNLVASNAAGAAKPAALGTVNTGDAGVAADAVIGSNALGICIVGGLAGELGSVLLQTMGLVPTTNA